MRDKINDPARLELMREAIGNSLGNSGKRSSGAKTLPGN